jgi:hypothetical protein
MLSIFPRPVALVISAVLAGLFIGLVTSEWNWSTAIAFTVPMLVAYGFLFRNPKAEGEQ